MTFCCVRKNEDEDGADISLRVKSRDALVNVVPDNITERTNFETFVIVSVTCFLRFLIPLNGYASLRLALSENKQVSVKRNRHFWFKKNRMRKDRTR